MLIKLKEKEGKKVRLVMTVTEAEVARLNRYKSFVEQEAGEEVEMNEVLLAMLKATIDNDKDFTRFEKGRRKKSTNTSQQGAAHGQSVSNGHDTNHLSSH